LLRLARFYAQGANPDWNILYQNEDVRKVSLPAYPFARTRCWIEIPETVSRDLNIFYEPRWILLSAQSTEDKNNRGKMSDGVILIFRHGNDFNLTKGLKEIYKDNKIVEIFLSDQYAEVSENVIKINHRKQKDFEKILQKQKLIAAIYFFGGLELADIKVLEIHEVDRVQELSVLSLLRLIKSLVSLNKIGQPIILKVITNNIHKVISSDKKLYPCSSSILGLAKTASREYPNLTVYSIDIARDDLKNKKHKASLVALIKNETGERGNYTEIALRNGYKYTREILPVCIDKKENVSLLRERGLYLVVGGTGAIGTRISIYLAKKYRAKIILTGRRKYDQIIESKIRAIERAGGEAMYVSADIRNFEQMQNVLKKIKDKFGRINGVIDSAVSIKNDLICNIDEKIFIDNLNVKTRGSFILNKITEQMPIDFFIFFSSVNSQMGLAGAANYVSGCIFQDNFSLFLDSVKSTPHLTINWGYWGDKSSSRHNDALSDLGILPITDKEGLAAFGKIISTDYKQIIAAKLTEAALKSLNIEWTKMISAQKLSAPDILPVILPVIRKQTIDLNKRNKQKLFKAQKAFFLIRQFGHLFLSKIFREMLVVKRRYTVDELRKEIGVIPRYNSLFAALLDILARAGYIRANGECVIATDKINYLNVRHIPDLTAAEKEIIKKIPDYAFHIKLMSACLKNFPAILTGKKNYMAVLFPNGSDCLVKNIYQGNITADNNNLLTSSVLEVYIQERIKHDRKIKINILEVGSGTGGASGAVLRRIKKYGQSVNYCYTDISLAFVKSARKKYGKKYPFVNFKILDIEKDSEQQDFLIGEYDIVLAANVLHATKNIRNTLLRVKKLLKTNGLLVLNENTKRSDFATLTFGLTAGWWLYEDGIYRIKHSPLLNLDQWGVFLENSGFNNIVLLGDNIIVASSDGMYERGITGKEQSEGRVQPLVETNIPLAKLKGKKEEKDYTDTEKKIASVWQEVLGYKEIDINDNFFEIGGNSLMIIRVQAAIKRQLNVDVAIAELFNRVTIRTLADCLSRQKIVKTTPIKPVPERETYNLSRAQKRTWIADNIAMDFPLYNLGFINEINGDPDRVALEKSLQALIDRHEAFRTGFVELSDGNPMQVIRQNIKADLKIVDLTAMNKDMAAGIKEDIIRQTVNAKFNFIKDELWRTVLIKLKPEKWLFVIAIHHIIADLRSLEIIFRELNSLYNAHLYNLPYPLLPLRIQYKDYAEYEQSPENEARLKIQEKYWLKQLSGELPILNLPIDFPRSAIQTYDSRIETVKMDKKIITALKELAEHNNVTLFVLFLAAFKVFLNRITGDEDIIVGTFATNRDQSELENIVGIMINSVALRTRLGKDLTFSGLLPLIKETVLAGLTNKDYPFEYVLEKINPVRDPSRSPVFSAVFQIFSLPKEQKNNPYELFLKQEVIDRTYGQYDIKLRLLENTNDSHLVLGYNNSLFKPETAKLFLQCFQTICESIIADPKQKISDLDIITAKEKHKLITDFNNAKASYPKTKTIHQLFEEQVKRTPDKIAIIYEQQKLTYRGLNQKANQLACYLRDKHKVKPDDIVALMLDRSPEMIIGILAILKAGGAYLPVDPDYPEERIRYMLRNSGAKIVLSDREYSRFSQKDCRTINIKNRKLVADLSEADPENRNKPGDLAYVMYTSGSTGEPKGVLQNHRNTIYHIIGYRRALNISTNDRISLLSSYCFDASVMDIFSSLLSGAELCPFDIKKQGIKALSEWISKNKITILHFAPTLFRNLINFISPQTTFPSVEKIVLGGERLFAKDHASFIGHFNKNCWFVNSYGPTESSVTTLYIIKNDRRTNLADHDYANIFIGRTILKTQTYILDKNQKFLPAGIPGELYISGDGLARGYLNDPEKTKQVFLPHPFRKGERIYKTGDLAKMHSDGNIEILGRIDHQIKIRGYRVEPGEIEVTVKKINNIKECIVIKHEEALVAYYATTDKNPLKAEDIKNRLRQILPDYMIPAYFIHLEKFPLNANGKLDRRALLPPAEKDLFKRKYEAPSGPIEEKLTAIWREVLGIKKISRHDNFFDLGGHSLKAIRLLSRINRELAVDLPLKDIFLYPILLNLAEKIGEKGKITPGIIKPAPKQDYYPLTLGQAAFWRATQNKKAAISNILTILEFTGKLDLDVLKLSLQEIVNRHEALRANFLMKDGRLAQIIKKHATVKFESINLLNTKEVKSAVAGIIRKEAETPFDLKSDLLIRFKIIKTGKKSSLLIVAVHHLVFDHFSYLVLFGDLITVYNSLLSGKKPAALASLKYTDCLLWEAEQKKKDLSRQEKYWLKIFSDKYPTLELPTDKLIKSNQNTNLENIEFMFVERVTTDKIKRICHNLNITPFMFFLAVYNVFLHKLSGKNDMMVGSPVNTRNSEEEGRVIGMFVSNLALRNRIENGDTFANFASRVRETVIKALENRNLPFSDLVEKNQHTFDPNRPLLNVFFRTIYYDNNFETTFDGKLTVKPLRVGFRNVSFDLELAVLAGPTWTQLMLAYNQGLFQKETVKKLLSYFYFILKEIESDAGIKIDSIKAWKK
ncbi:MAG: amino acid adenylation domain-containing protein, partial [Candidatus Falkowbacteria bacterium]